MEYQQLLTYYSEASQQLSAIHLTICTLIADLADRKEPDLLKNVCWAREYLTSASQSICFSLDYLALAIKRIREIEVSRSQSA